MRCKEEGREGARFVILAFSSVREIQDVVLQVALRTNFSHHSRQTVSYT